MTPVLPLRPVQSQGEAIGEPWRWHATCLCSRRHASFHPGTAVRSSRGAPLPLPRRARARARACGAAVRRLRARQQLTPTSRPRVCLLTRGANAGRAAFPGSGDWPQPFVHAEAWCGPAGQWEGKQFSVVSAPRRGRGARRRDDFTTQTPTCAQP